MTRTLPDVVLSGGAVRLEPLRLAHAESLARAFGESPVEAYPLVTVPRTVEAAASYVERALEASRVGAAVPFVVVRLGRGRGPDVVAGTTRFYDIAWWEWPEGHKWHERATPDVCEIGYTRLAAEAMGTAVNVEAKLLMLTHAFETWAAHRVTWRTDVRNERSRRAIAALGATFEGVRRADKVADDATVRDSAVYSMTLAEWPALKPRIAARLQARLVVAEGR